MSALLEARDVQVRIGGTPILHAADLSLDAGRLVAVVGPNGAGKSTLVRAVSGLQDIAGGSVRWRGEDLRAIRRAGSRGCAPSSRNARPCRTGSRCARP